MKSVSTFLLLIIHFVVTTGFSVSTHYCMGKIDGISLGVAKTDQCSVCGMHTEDSNGCCRDEIKVVMLQQDEQLAKVIVSSFGVDQHFATTSSYYISERQKLHIPINEFSVIPPLLNSQPVYLSNRVFRI